MKAFRKFKRIAATAALPGPGPGRKNAVLITVLCACTLAAGTLMATAPAPIPVSPDEKRWPVTGIQVEGAWLSPEVSLFGRVESPHHSTLRSAIGAAVDRIHVSEGQWVRRGDTLVSLDPAEEALRLQQARAELADREAQLAALQKDFEAEQRVLARMQELYDFTDARAQRLRELEDRQLIATEQMENTLQDVARQGIELARQQALVHKHPQRLAQARAAVERARSQLESQRLNLDRSTIRAPFDGRVTALMAAPGDRVADGTALLTLYDTSALQVRATLPSSAVEILRDALARGEPITARASGIEQHLPLTALAGQVEAGQAGVQALLQVPAGRDLPALGQALSLHLSLPRVRAFAVPPQSVYDNRRIYLIEDDRLRGVEVEVVGQRRTDSGELEMLVRSDSLTGKQTVLASHLPRASHGLPVAPSGGGQLAQQHTQPAAKDRTG